MINYTNITVLGIIHKNGGGVRKTVFPLLQQHVLGAVKVNQTWGTTNVVFVIVIHHWRKYENCITIIS